MATARIDVVVPVFNAASTLKDSVASIQNQTFDDLHIVLVDDGSTDGTSDILARIAGEDARVTVLRQENNGIVDALNYGCRVSTAPLIARHDADDLAAVDRLAKQVDFFENHPEFVAVSGVARHIDLKGRLTGEYARYWPPDTADAQWVPAREPALMHPFLMIRRSAFEQVGGYRYAFHAEDADLYWRLQEIGSLHNMADILGDYRLNPDSVSSRSIVNGRIQALSSQLAAISALRRRSGGRDLDFVKRSLVDYEAAYSLDGMVSLAGVQLDGAELAKLRLSVADKLVDATTYRPYELEASDCRFIAAALQGLNDVPTAANRDIILRHISGASAMLLLRGRIADVLTLCPKSLYFSTVLRAIVRILTPDKLRRKIAKTLRNGA